MAAKKKTTKQLFLKFYVDVSIYCTQVCFIITEDRKRAAAFIYEKLGKEAEEFFLSGSATAMTLRATDNHCEIIWLPVIPVTTADLATVGHEVFHATNLILQRCGVELTDGGEAYAYLLGFLMYESLNRMAKSKR